MSYPITPTVAVAPTFMSELHELDFIPGFNPDGNPPQNIVGKRHWSEHAII